MTRQRRGRATRITLPCVLAGLAVAGAETRRATTEMEPLLSLVERNQGIRLGSAVDGDRTSRTLPHFQLLRERGGGAATLNSLERHPDGTVYLSYTAPVSPAWYDVRRADDAEDTRSDPIATGHGARAFVELQADNLDDARWLAAGRAFPPGLGPAPRWLVIPLPPVDPCAAHRGDLAQLARRLAGAGCRPIPVAGWSAFFAAASQAQVNGLVPHATTPLSGSGDYCSRQVVSTLDPILRVLNPNSGPPGWTTVLAKNWPVDGRERNNGERKYYADLPLRWPGNHYVTAEELVRLAQTDSARLRKILEWSRRPSHGDVMDRPIPWIASAVEGVVTNSFLSGADYAGDHAEAPDGYWLGDPPPNGSEQCGVFNAQHALCDDWIVLVRPDPEYRFLLAQDREREPGTDKGLGNFGAELQGSLEAEIEQWLIPAGYRPEPGDRTHLTGRWVVDCGHDDWHAELHPIESFVTSHSRLNAGALGKLEVAATVVVTGDWPGGELRLDLWPPARPSPDAVLRWRPERHGVAQGLTVEERAEPADNPNHLHLTVASLEPAAPLVTGNWNEVHPQQTRRLAAKYFLWWSVR